MASFDESVVCRRGRGNERVDACWARKSVKEGFQTLSSWTFRVLGNSIMVLGAPAGYIVGFLVALR